MIRIEKILNHNAIIGVQEKDKRECLVLGNGIAYGKKVHEKIKIREKDVIYFLENATERVINEERNDK